MGILVTWNEFTVVVNDLTALLTEAGWLTQTITDANNVVLGVRARSPEITDAPQRYLWLELKRRNETETLPTTITVYRRGTATTYSDPIVLGTTAIVPGRYFLSVGKAHFVLCPPPTQTPRLQHGTWVFALSPVARVLPPDSDYTPFALITDRTETDLEVKYPTSVPFAPTHVLQDSEGNTTNTIYAAAIVVPTTLPFQQSVHEASIAPLLFPTVVNNILHVRWYVDGLYVLWRRQHSFSLLDLQDAEFSKRVLLPEGRELVIAGELPPGRLFLLVP